MLLYNINSDCSKPYAEWDYAWPFEGYYISAESSFEANQPQMIEIPQVVTKALCLEDQDCAVTISVRGIDAVDEKDSHVRLRVFNGTNKLYPEVPIHGSASGKGTF